MSHAFKQQKKHYLQSIILLLTVILMPHHVLADEEYGRYRAIVLHGDQTNSSGNVVPRVFIIDSKEGHMWTLDQKTKLHNLKNDFTLGTVLTYQGKVRPGKKMGDIVEQAPSW
jgi:hypothetical protein